MSSLEYHLINFFGRNENSKKINLIGNEAELPLSPFYTDINDKKKKLFHVKNLVNLLYFFY